MKFLSLFGPFFAVTLLFSCLALAKKLSVPEAEIFDHVPIHEIRDRIPVQLRERLFQPNLVFQPDLVQTDLVLTVKPSPPLDEYDLVNRKYLEDLFAKPKAAKGFVQEKLSRNLYNSKQKGNLANQLKEERKGFGVAFFLTNGKNFGKLLYTWGVGPKLHLKNIVVFRDDDILVIESVAIGAAGHLDLDTGKGTHKPGVFDDEYKPDLHFSNVNGQIMFVSETDGSRFLFPMKSIRKFPFYKRD
jgi:hypothetical protein